MNGASKKSLSERVAVKAAPISEAAAGAILTIDLSAIRENYRRLKVRLGGVNCAGVVKADGYGLGGAQVAAALATEGCAIFFVAHLAEGALLRQALGARPAIYVLNGIQPGAESEAVAAELGVVINSAGQLAAWRAAAQRAGRRLKAAIQVDSGMSRLGMAAAEVEAVAADPQAFDGIDVTLVMSHLARADEREHPANEQQRLEFERLRMMLPKAPASLANSSGIFLGQSFHYDLARPGAALYGINPTPAQENPMLPVVRLQAKIIQTRSLDRGAGIGYGHIFHVTDSLIAATISLGYADGWHRRAASAAWFENVRLPFLGRVSMDSIVLDISALPPGRLKAGDLVELIGPLQTVDQAAGHAGTIGYEILTSLGNRFHRRYVNG
ncbi:alanine racemase [Mesorhizobium sp.]|uniref:alanine racemase n=1 Tax=Mesorhizobium sp. TaxID=1871066 RepID=UPI000FE8E8DA|nr:alanine racemase [Mesorhizobium sp.]RWK34256.1 MAG: alanine racemase [Mesorhizobium sp.]RWK66338.1 MAG: alanine racemase [Mesorhizobium sp.]RWK72585.1 MAG: alanine racemase [Mesorhizobium sp.]RWK80771.1 MAG: alanine racemase [Mesorhizobium sp.]RWL08069.1 MAG: alanine racemase [Mesorhizobium sp.]